MAEETILQNVMIFSGIETTTFRIVEKAPQPFTLPQAMKCLPAAPEVISMRHERHRRRRVQQLFYR
jgi:hypothetical protein